MAFTLRAFLPTLGMLAGMLVCLWVGRWIGRRRGVGEGGREEVGVEAVDGAIFALFGLMVAFTFSGASNRFEHRRAQIVTEANAVGTAYLRLDLLPAEAQPPLRALFREYLASRLATYRKLPDEEAARSEYERSVALQNEIWSRAVAAARSAHDPAVLSLVVSSLNEMIDITTARLAATRTHVPPVIVAVLFGLAFASALVVGFSTAANEGRSWFRAVVFAFVIAASIYVTLDLEYPRFGFIRIDPADRLLDELLLQMR